MSSGNGTLTPTGYLVLGLLAGMGPSTPYELKQMVAASIGHFWSFPHSQLYAEPERLADAGLAGVEQEAGGRRRKVYSITPAGRRALEAWLSDARAEAGEIRNPGLLKLFFGAMARTDDVVALARAHEAEQRRRLAEFEQLERGLEGHPDLAFPLATLRLGMAHARAEADFWADVARHPPGGGRPRRRAR